MRSGAKLAVQLDSLRGRYRVGVATFDADRGLLIDSFGAEISLRAQSLKVLRILLAHNGGVVEREELMDRVWATVVVTDDSLGHCISDIRKAIADGGHTMLITAARRGYRLVAQPLPSGQGAETPEPAQAALGWLPPRGLRSRRLVWGLSFCVIVLGAALVWLLSHPQG